MEKQGYTYLVEVKCKAPAGYKPRTMTYKGIGFGKNQKSHSQIEELAVEKVKTSLEKNNEGIPIEVSAKATLYKSSFVVDTNE